MVSSIEKTVIKAEWELKEHPIISGVLIASSVLVNLAGDIVCNPLGTYRFLKREAVNFAKSIPSRARMLKYQIPYSSYRILPD
jgi:hypothetical protein